MIGMGVVNGVDTDKLSATIEAVKATPMVARFRFRAENRWIGGGHTRTQVLSFDGAGEEGHPRPANMTIDADEPPVLLGKDRGANPVEYLLAAIEACVTTSIVYHAAARGIRLNSVGSRIEGTIDLRGFLGVDPAVRRGFKEIRMVVDVDADAPAAEIAEIVERGQGFSPVFDSVSNGVPITVRLGKAKGR